MFGYSLHCPSVRHTQEGAPRAHARNACRHCFLLRTGPDGLDEVLILRRSGRVRTYKGRWAAVSGYLEGGPEEAAEQARREIYEETGLAEAHIELQRASEPFTFDDAKLDMCWTVHPFLFRVRPGAAITIDWEHTESRWVRPRSLGRYRAVPRLKEALARVYPPIEDRAP